MKILVTGATGFLEKYLLPVLKERGYSIVVLTRNLESAGFHLPVHCELHSWKPVAGKPSINLFEDVKAVVHLVGAGIGNQRWSLARKHKILSPRVDATRNLIHALKEVPKKTNVFISASAIGIYGDTGESLVGESESPGSGFLADVCRQ